MRWPWLAISFAWPRHHRRRPGAAVGAASDPSIEALLDEAILRDIVEQYAEYEQSTCDSPSSPAVDKTSFVLAHPGVNAASGWNPDFVPFEESLFQAMLSHGDGGGGRRSWSIRIGRGGQMYSHFAPDMHGETMPGQNNEGAPWVDEVQQSVSVALQLNQNLSNPRYCPGPNAEDPAQCKKYYVHQAGAYQKDGNYTSVPFFSPALARHCERNFCIFATWGTSAQVPVPFTSPILFINKFTNCDDGIIEHTQMIHK
jgi:hypothetical protein